MAKSIDTYHVQFDENATHLKIYNLHCEATFPIYKVDNFFHLITHNDLR